MFLYKHFMKPPGRPKAREDELDEEDADIWRNLEFVLSTKRGCGFLPQSTFGLSELAFRTPEQYVVVLTKELEENIRLYEPRVEVMKIEDVYDDDGQRVHLRVLLRRRGARTRLQLVVDLKNGSFDIQPAGRESAGEKER